MQPITSSSTGSYIDLHGTVAVVTGGASGIGRSCAEKFHAAGASVVTADLRHTDSELNENADSYLNIQCDVSDETSVIQLFSRVTAIYGKIDILVNCAGVLEEVRRTVDQEVADWDRVTAINARGTFLCCREAGRIMTERRSGSIVNIGSAAGLVGIPASNAYGPSKAAVAYMTRSLAGEWSRLGVRVNCIAPGYIETPMSAELFDLHASSLSSALKRVPLARLGQPDEVANVVLFLCSSLASYITGTILPVDGGWSGFGGVSR